MTPQALIPKRDFYNLLGSLCKKPQLLIQDKVDLRLEDFEEEFFKILFGTINNIIINNIEIEKITPVDIDNEIAKITKNYDIYNNNEGFKYVSQICENANEQLFFDNLKRIKKFSLLRDLDRAGFDISDIYDYKTIDMNKQKNQREHLETLEINEIIDAFTLKLAGIKTQWNMEGHFQSYLVSEGLSTLLEDLHKNPDYGFPYLNEYYNAIFGGMKKSKLIIRSAGTGVGKTRLALADIAAISCTELYDFKTKSFKKNGEVFATTFISTELELQELQTCLLAIISGVAEDVIKKGNFSAEIFDRIKKAIEILEKSPIYLHYIDDFSVMDIENIIEKDILQYDSQFVFFDYIQVTPKLSRTMAEAFGSNLREDQILVNLSSRLKLIANKYDIYLSTATQLNRTAKEHENRDATAIRGGMATIDKADVGIMCFKATEKDKKNLEHILKRGNYLVPNFCHYIYKHRGGRNNIIVWTQLNPANVRETICFCTDFDYNLLGDIQPLDIRFEPIEKEKFGN